MITITQNHEIILDLRSQFALTLRFTSWDSDFRLFRETATEIEEITVDPSLSILSLLETESVHKECNSIDFYDLVPQAIWQAVSRYTFYQTRLLQWAARYAWAHDLLLSNANLCWLLLIKAEKAKWSTEKLAQVAHFNQRLILKAIIGQENAAMVKFIKKIVVEEACHDDAKHITWILQNGAMRKRLAHFKQVSVKCIEVLSRYPEFLDWFFLEDINRAALEDRRFKISRSGKLICHHAGL